MATITRIKRSDTAGNPSTLGQGELAYSALADNGSNGGDRLYIGMGTETSGDAVNHIVIGGKYFTDKLNHTPGVVTALKALLVDSNKKLDELNVDNITINGNTISSTNTNGNIVLAPNGTGKLSFNGVYSFPTTDGTTNQFLKTDGLGVLSWTSIPSSSFTISGDSGSDTFNTGETLTFTGGVGLTSTITNNTVTFDVDSTVAIKTDTHYVGTTAVALNRASAKQALTGISQVTFPGSTSGSVVLVPAAVAGANTITMPAATGTIALLNGKLNQFAATTSAELAGVISDETGSGSLVFATSPTLITPNIGAATATSITGSGALTLSAGGTNTNVVLVPNGTGTVDFSSKRATNAADPLSGQDLATKAYVDATRQGLDIKDSVRVATTAALTVTNTATTLTNAGVQAAITIDSIPLALNDSVLVKDQPTQAQNGLYTVTTVGTASTNWVLTRRSDFTTGATVSSGAFTFVEDGTNNKASGWVLTTTGAITFGTTSLTFTQFSGAGLIDAGDGLIKTGNRIDANVGNGIAIVGDVIQLASTVAGNGLTLTSGVIAAVGTANRITVSADAIDISTSYVGQSSITTVGALTSGSLGAGFTAVGVAQGGTGAVTLLTRGILFGNGTGAVGAVTASLTDGSFLRQDAAGNAYWTNVIDGGTY